MFERIHFQKNLLPYILAYKPTQARAGQIRPKIMVYKCSCLNKNPYVIMIKFKMFAKTKSFTYFFVRESSKISFLTQFLTLLWLRRP